MRSLSNNGDNCDDEVDCDVNIDSMSCDDLVDSCRRRSDANIDLMNCDDLILLTFADVRYFYRFDDNDWFTGKLASYPIKSCDWFRWWILLFTTFGVAIDEVVNFAFTRLGDFEPIRLFDEKLASQNCAMKYFAFTLYIFTSFKRSAVGDGLANRFQNVCILN